VYDIGGIPNSIVIYLENYPFTFMHSIADSIVLTIVNRKVPFLDFGSSKRSIY